jgi:hypothetical protein
MLVVLRRAMESLDGVVCVLMQVRVVCILWEWGSTRRRSANNNHTDADRHGDLATISTTVPPLGVIWSPSLPVARPFPCLPCMQQQKQQPGACDV